MEQMQLDRALPDGFQVLASSERAQVATMVLEPGETVGGPDSRHERSDQWLYVIGGEGTPSSGAKRSNYERGVSCGSTRASATGSTTMGAFR